MLDPIGYNTLGMDPNLLLRKREGSGSVPNPRVRIQGSRSGFVSNATVTGTLFMAQIILNSSRLSIRTWLRPQCRMCQLSVAASAWPEIALCFCDWADPREQPNIQCKDSESTNFFT